MQVYLDLMQDIIANGHHHSDRTGVGRTSVYGRMLRWDLAKGFPLMTTRAVPFKAIVKELLWFISGDTSVKSLQDVGVHIWDSWAVDKSHIEEFVKKHGGVMGIYAETMLNSMAEQFVGSIGPMYGYNWRSAPIDDVSVFLPFVDEKDVAPDRLKLYKEQFNYLLEYNSEVQETDWPNYLRAAYYKQVDQLQQLMVNLRDRPFSSRHVVVSWIPGSAALETVSSQENVLLGKGALAACHTMFQCFVTEKEGVKKLSMMMTQRSCDVPVGGVFNVAQYSLLTMMMAKVLGYEVGEFIWSLGDAHIYDNQLDLVKTHLERKPGQLPYIEFNRVPSDMYSWTIDDISLKDYHADKVISYPISV